MFNDELTLRDFIILVKSSPGRCITLVAIKRLKLQMACRLREAMGLSRVQTNPYSFSTIEWEMFGH